MSDSDSEDPKSFISNLSKASEMLTDSDDDSENSNNPIDKLDSSSIFAKHRMWDETDFALETQHSKNKTVNNSYLKTPSDINKNVEKSDIKKSSLSNLNVNASNEKDYLDETFDSEDEESEKIKFFKELDSRNNLEISQLHKDTHSYNDDSIFEIEEFQVNVLSTEGDKNESENLQQFQQNEIINDEAGSLNDFSIGSEEARNEYLKQLETIDENDFSSVSSIKNFQSSEVKDESNLSDNEDSSLLKSLSTVPDIKSKLKENNNEVPKVIPASKFSVLTDEANNKPLDISKAGAGDAGGKNLSAKLEDCTKKNSNAYSLISDNNENKLDEFKVFTNENLDTSFAPVSITSDLENVTKNDFDTSFEYSESIMVNSTKETELLESVEVAKNEQLHEFVENPDENKVKSYENTAKGSDDITNTIVIETKTIENVGNANEENQTVENFSLNATEENAMQDTLKTSLRKGDDSILEDKARKYDEQHQINLKAEPSNIDEHAEYPIKKSLDLENKGFRQDTHLSFNDFLKMQSMENIENEFKNSKPQKVVKSVPLIKTNPHPQALSKVVKHPIKSPKIKTPATSTRIFNKNTAIKKVEDKIYAKKQPTQQHFKMNETLENDNSPEILELKIKLSSKDEEIFHLQEELASKSQDLVSLREEIILIERMNESKRENQMNFFERFNYEGADVNDIKNAILEQETLIRGFQSENEKLLLQMKNLKKEFTEKEKVQFLKQEQLLRENQNLKKQLEEKLGIDYKMKMKLETLENENRMLKLKEIELIENNKTEIANLHLMLNESESSKGTDLKEAKLELDRVKNDYGLYIKELEEEKKENTSTKKPLQKKGILKSSENKMLNSMEIKTLKEKVIKLEIEKDFATREVAKLKNEKNNIRLESEISLKDLQDKYESLKKFKSDSDLKNLAKMEEMANTIETLKSKESKFESSLMLKNDDVLKQLREENFNLRQKNQKLDMQAVDMNFDLNLKIKKLEKELEYLSSENMELKTKCDESAKNNTLQDNKLLEENFTLKLKNKDLNYKFNEFKEKCLILENTKDSNENLIKLLRKSQEDTINYYEKLLSESRKLSEETDKRNKKMKKNFELEIEFLGDRLKKSENSYAELELKFEEKNNKTKNEKPNYFAIEEMEDYKAVKEKNKTLTEELERIKAVMKPEHIKFNDLSIKIKLLEEQIKNREDKIGLEIQKRLNVLELEYKNELELVTKKKNEELRKKHMEVLKFRREMDLLLSMISEFKNNT
ncbi:hypothetical protein HDU92_001013 [Lobulomyces angularis]|nr:hypothetical protein HDU92_001013 [Lobulomyces angularis]